MQPITNSRLLELRRRRQACQQASDENLHLQLEKDFLDLYDVFEKHISGETQNQVEFNIGVLF